MSSDSVDFENYFDGIDGTLRKPPSFLLFVGLSLVILGFLLGVYGFLNSTGATNNEQFLFGGLGYLSAGLIPIVILQVIRAKHLSALSNNEEGDYDIFAGNKLQSRYLKVVLLGLIAAALPIWVFLSPIAEKLA